MERKLPSHKTIQQQIFTHIEPIFDYNDNTNSIDNNEPQSYRTNRSRTLFSARPVLHTTNTKLNTTTVIAQDVEFKLCCITWNMHGINPTREDVINLLSPHQNYDIYAIGSEECMRSIAKSFLFSSKSHWETLLKQYLGRDYVFLRSVTLNAIHLIVFIKKDIIAHITNVGDNIVKTGFKNLIGNKGGVGVWFNINNVSFLIVNCHLAAGSKGLSQRNIDFMHIMNNMLPTGKEVNFFVFMGDLNYRVSCGNPTVVKKLLSEKNFIELFNYDELVKEKGNGVIRRFEFTEAGINFQPTFKFKDNTDEYKYDNDNHIPSWTDRILYRIKEPRNIRFDVGIKEYNSMMNVKSSDHKPVYTVFNICIINNY